MDRTFFAALLGEPLAMDESFDPYLELLGIAADRRPPTHYDLLGLAPLEPSVEQIIQASLARASKLREFMLGPWQSDATRLSLELSRARAVLSDPELKLDYDQQLRRKNSLFSKTAQNDGVPSLNAPEPVQEEASEPDEVAPTRWPGWRLIGIATCGAMLIVPMAFWALKRSDAPDLESVRSYSASSRVPPQPAHQTEAIVGVPPADKAAESATTADQRVAPAEADTRAGRTKAATRTENRAPVPPALHTSEKSLEPKMAGEQPPPPADAPRVALVPSEPKRTPDMKGPALAPRQSSPPPKLLEALERLDTRTVSARSYEIRSAFLSPLSTRAVSALESEKQTPIGCFTFSVKTAVPQFDGPALILAKGGKPRALLGYSKGKRHGALEVWDIEGKVQLFAEYRGGKRVGINCYCQGGKPVIVEAWGYDQKPTTYWIEFTGGAPKLIDVEDLDASNNQQSQEAQQRLRDLEEQIRVEENRWRSEFARWWHEHDADLKKIRREKVETSREFADRRNRAFQRAKDLSRQNSNMLQEMIAIATNETSR